MNFRKVLSLFTALTVVLIANVSVCYAGTLVTTDTVRVNNIGAVITAELKGEANSEVSVELLKPGGKLPSADTDMRNFFDNLAYIESANLNSEGKFSFTYTADVVGLYTLRVRSNADIDISFSGNDIEASETEDIYAEVWDTSGSDFGDALNYRLEVTAQELNTYGCEAVAKFVKAKLDLKPEGKRTLFINRSLSPGTNAKNILWWDDETEETAALMDEFFKAYYNIGGNLDFIYSDFENYVSMWQFTADANDSGDYSAIDQIANDERYHEFKSVLLSHGYCEEDDTDETQYNGKKTVGELHSIVNFTTSANYHIFNVAAANMAAEYHNCAIYEPAKKYFKNVKYSDYGFSDLKQYLGNSDAMHRAYLGGNTYKAGSHSAPVLYSKNTRGYWWIDTYDIMKNGAEAEQNTLPATDFGELMGTVAKLRVSALSTEGGNVTPYVHISGDDFLQSGYFDETILHTGLHNPDPILFFGAKVDDISDNQAEERLGRLSNLLEELNGFAADYDKESLNNHQLDFNADYCLSGMYANGKNIWRITPDTEKVSREDFLVSADESQAVFKAGNVTVTFPKGEIKENKYSSIGYWVVTSEDVKPVITYDNTGDASLETVFKVYDADGSEYDIAENNTVLIDEQSRFEVVAAYINCYTDGLWMISAAFKGDGTLCSAETLKCGEVSPNNAEIVANVKIPDDAEYVKVFFWNDYMPLTEGVRFQRKR